MALASIKKKLEEKKKKEETISPSSKENISAADNKSNNKKTENKKKSEFSEKEISHSSAKTNANAKPDKEQKKPSENKEDNKKSVKPTTLKTPSNSLSKPEKRKPRKTKKQIKTELIAAEIEERQRKRQEEERLKKEQKKQEQEARKKTKKEKPATPKPSASNKDLTQKKTPATQSLTGFTVAYVPKNFNSSELQTEEKSPPVNDSKLQFGNVTLLAKRKPGNPANHNPTLFQHEVKANNEEPQYYLPPGWQEEEKDSPPPETITHSTQAIKNNVLLETAVNKLATTLKGCEDFTGESICHIHTVAALSQRGSSLFKNSESIEQALHDRFIAYLKQYKNLMDEGESVPDQLKQNIVTLVKKIRTRAHENTEKGVSVIIKP